MIWAWDIKANCACTFTVPWLCRNFFENHICLLDHTFYLIQIYDTFLKLEIIEMSANINVPSSDHDDDAFLPSGQRSRRCTTVSIGRESDYGSWARGIDQYHMMRCWLTSIVWETFGCSPLSRVECFILSRSDVVDRRNQRTLRIHYWSVTTTLMGHEEKRILATENFVWVFCFVLITLRFHEYVLVLQNGVNSLFFRLGTE